MRWTEGRANRFLDELETAPVCDLPLFAGRAVPATDEEVRIVREGPAALALKRRLLATAARRAGTTVREAAGRRHLALAVPGGPALLATRLAGGDRWRVLLAFGGSLARRIRAGIADGKEATGNLGRAA
jgi:hypothetical protein